MINSNQFSLRLTNEQKACLNELYPDLSVKDIFGILFENNENKPDNSEQIEQIKADYNNLADEKDVEIRCLNETIDFLNKKVAKLKNRKPEVMENRVEVAIEKERELSTNELLLTLPEPCRRLLNEYAARLETTAENILIYTLFRYCVERYTLNMWDFANQFKLRIILRL